jgi:hypothetical protein
MPHSLFKIAGQLSVLTFEQHANVCRSFEIFFLGAQTLYAWPKTPLQMILKAGPRQIAVYLDLASAQLKGAVDEIQSVAG